MTSENTPKSPETFGAGLQMDSFCDTIHPVKIGGGRMANGYKVQAVLSDVTMERLDKLCAEKGLKRAAVITLGIEKLWKEEHSDEK